MIFIDRNRIVKPTYFTSEEYRRDVLELENYYSAKALRRTQNTYSNLFFVEKIYPELLSLFNNRCAYCEREFFFKS